MLLAYTGGMTCHQHRACNLRPNDCRPTHRVPLSLERTKARGRAVGSGRPYERGVWKYAASHLSPARPAACTRSRPLECARATRAGPDRHTLNTQSEYVQTPIWTPVHRIDLYTCVQTPRAWLDMRATRAGVGGTSGSPSDQPSAAMRSKASAIFTCECAAVNSARAR